MPEIYSKLMDKAGEVDAEDLVNYWHSCDMSSRGLCPGGCCECLAESIELYTKHAVDDEREACAKECGDVYQRHLEGHPLARSLGSHGQVLSVAAALIRDRDNHG